MRMPRQKTKVDPGIVIPLIAESRSIAEVLKKLALSSGAVHYRKINEIIKEYNIDISHMTGKAWNKGQTFIKKDISFWLKENTKIGSSSLKQRLFKANVFIKQCLICKITEWNGKPAPLELDHINGSHSDNRIENLRILCSNCHAQTDNYCGRNQTRRKSPGLGELAYPEFLKNSDESHTSSNLVPRTIISKEKYKPKLKVTISNEELAKLVWEVPQYIIAKRFCMSDKGLAKHCKRNNIPTPPQGYWTSVNKRVKARTKK